MRSGHPKFLKIKIVLKIIYPPPLLFPKIKSWLRVWLTRDDYVKCRSTILFKYYCSKYDITLRINSSHVYIVRCESWQHYYIIHIVLHYTIQYLHRQKYKEICLYGREMLRFRFYCANNYSTIINGV